MLERSEIRRDYIHNRTVIVAPNRAKRPHNFEAHVPPAATPKATCPFCPEKIDKVQPLDVVGGMNPWRAKSIRNIFPVVTTENPKAYGQQEVIIETPQHGVEFAELSVDHIASVLQLYQRRTVALAKNQKLNYILIFKNNGGRAGASIDHAHSQIFASEVLPPHIYDKLRRAQEYTIQKGSCYYCEMIAKERKGLRRIWENRSMVAIAPYASTYNYEAWILARTHFDNITELGGREITDLAELLKKLLVKVNELQLPYNLYLHQVAKYRDEHFYLRIAPRRDIWAGVELGARLIINTVPPEDAAKFYRGGRF